MKKLKLSKKAVAVTAVAALFLGGGAAFAYWTFGGAGTGSAKVAANPTQGIVVTQTTAINNMVPGMRVDLAGLLTNPNVTDVKVGTLTAAISSVSTGVAADFTLANPIQVINQVVMKDAPVGWSGVSLAYANSAVNQDNAKGATVTLTYTLTPFVEPPPVVPAAVTLVGGLLTVNYTNPALNGTFYSACVGNGLFNPPPLPSPVRECLSAQFNSGVFNGTLQVTGFPITVGNTYTFGVYPLGYNTTAVYTLAVVAQ